ncbi:MAG: hypothetical protein ACLGHL_00530 [Actinomycetota bacterium]
MYVRIVLWNLEGSNTSIEELRTYLAEESVDAFSAVEGLALKLWVSDPETDRWGAIYLWGSREAAAQPLPSKARQMIGKEPDQVMEFQLEASARGVTDLTDLARLGAAF